MPFGFYAYPWNLHDPRTDLAQMKDAGMGHVAVAASYHAGKFLQPRDPRARVYFPRMAPSISSFRRAMAG
ncbi:MAG: hypothetical protein WDN06_02025 [Asticcacaulis sp.]